jgi:hypothetical protein
MNPLASIKKNLRGLEEAFGQAKSKETRWKCEEAMRESVGRMVPRWFEHAGPTATLSVNGVPVLNGGEVATESVGAVVPSETVTVNCAAPVGAVAVVDKAQPPIDGWPVEAEIQVGGLFPNRRRLKGELEDGRVVAVERRPGVQTGSRVVGKLVLGGRPPLYRVVEQKAVV